MNLPQTHQTLKDSCLALVNASSKQESRERFEEMQEALFQLPQLPEDAYETEEWVSGGMYCRKILVPQGSLITGRVYKFDHLEIMVEGDISIVQASGDKKRYQGYNVIEAKAGKRQAGFAHKDTIWMTVNRVPNIPMDYMLDYTACKSYEDFETYHREVNKQDYLNLLSELGITEDQMQEMVRVDDVVEMNFSHIYTDDSKLHGKGLFSKRPFKKGELICPARQGDKRTIAGRYSNHAMFPNTLPCKHEGEFYLVADKDIEAGEEITMNYRHVLSFRQREDS